MSARRGCKEVTTMPTVFPRYRRSDTQGEAGRLAEVLQLKLGRRVVFRDVESISPGDQFDAVIESQLAIAEIILVLIVPTWLGELKNMLTQVVRMTIAW